MSRRRTLDVKGWFHSDPDRRSSRRPPLKTTIAVSRRPRRDQLDALRRLLEEAFGPDFTEEDWRHGLGGLHAWLRLDGDLVAHAAVVPRTLHLDGVRLHVGYVESVAVRPALQRRGLGSLLMEALHPHLETFDLGVLSSGSPAFYERLGWHRWRGRTWVRTAAGRVRTRDEDDGILVRATARTAATTGVPLPLRGDLECEERPGDDW